MNKPTLWNPFRRGTSLEEWRPFGRWNPMREMEAIQNRMDDLFRSFPGLPEVKESMAASDWIPAVDITEDDHEYLLKFELPELNKKDIKVTVDDGTLSITGERKSEKEEKNKKIHRIERSYGRFERTFTLPDNADPAKVTSHYKDGVLEVHVAKNPEAKPKSVEVKVD